jgi:tripartite-type tricarboxylate transporter receptor subunit TctC
VKTTLINALAAFAACCAGQAIAQGAYPARAITMVVPFSAGGGVDLIARIIAQKLGSQMGVPIAVVNRAGANGNIAAESVARAPADGYTLLASSSAIAISPALYSQLSYDVMKDLAPIAQVSITPYVLIAHPSLPVKTPAEFLKLARASAGKMSFSSNGVGNITHLGTVILMQANGFDALHVPYKGAAEAVTAMAAGFVDFSLQTPGAIGAYLQAKRLKALAVTTLKRSALLPEVPTLSETVTPGFELSTWLGVMAPARTPTAVIERLNREIVQALNDAEVRHRFAGVDTIPVGSPASQYGAYVRGEIERWTTAARKAGVKPE